MTKEQWLENMKSETPDYKGLLDELSVTQDKDLINYLIDGMPPSMMNIFVENVIASDKMDWVLSEDDMDLLNQTIEENRLGDEHEN